jgi:CRP/FNR family transcriptional regulator
MGSDVKTKIGDSVFGKTSLQFISQEEFEEIDATSVLLPFKKGETILKQGHRHTHIAFLQSGIVKFSYYQENSNKDTILTLLTAPKILGGANLFFKDDNLFSIVAVEDCEVYMIDANVLYRLMDENGRLAVNLFMLASDMFKKSIFNFISVATKQKEARIADVFIYLTEEIYHATSFKLSLTRKELAQYACCSVENVIMTLSKWQSEGIVSSSGKNFEIREIDKLKYISKVG